MALSYSISQIDYFGVAPVDSGDAINIAGKTITPASVAGYFRIDYGQAAYSPIEYHDKLIGKGWNPDAVLVANNLLVFNPFIKYTSLGINAKDAAELAAKIWCLHFQDIGSVVYIPRMLVECRESTDGRAGKIVSSDVVGGYTRSWSQILEDLFNVNVIEGKTSELKSSLSSTDLYDIVSKIVEIDIKTISPTNTVLNYNSFELATNWSFWSQEVEESGKPMGNLVIPPGSFLLKVKSTKNNAPLYKIPNGEKISVLPAGTSLIQTLPMDKAGFWGAIDSNGVNGFVNNEDVYMDRIFYGPKPESNKTDTGSGDTTPVKSETNWLLYGGIGAGVLVLGGAAYFLMRKK